MHKVLMTAASLLALAGSAQADRKVLIAAASVLALAAPAEAKARFRPFVFFTLPMHHHDSVWRKSDYTQARLIALSQVRLNVVSSPC
jgi:hypothetical protein